MTGATGYSARCSLCEWASGQRDDDDDAFTALALHGLMEHPEVSFPGGELVPVIR